MKRRYIVKCIRCSKFMGWFLESSSEAICTFCLSVEKERDIEEKEQYLRHQHFGFDEFESDRTQEGLK